jgi:hypothetical protein
MRPPLQGSGHAPTPTRSAAVADVAVTTGVAAEEPQETAEPAVRAISADSAAVRIRCVGFVSIDSSSAVRPHAGMVASTDDLCRRAHEIRVARWQGTTFFVPGDRADDRS